MWNLPQMMRVHDVQTTCCFLPFFYSPTYDFKALRLRASGRNNPNIVAPTMLGIVACMLAVVCKRMQQLPTMLRQQCWELLRACWQWCANGCNNSQQCCANNVGNCCVHVGSGVQTDATTPNNVGTCSASWERYNP